MSPITLDEKVTIQKQRNCTHPVIQPYENEDEDVEVCVECDYVVHEGRAFKRKPGRIIRRTIAGFPRFSRIEDNKRCLAMTRVTMMTAPRPAKT